MSCSEEDARYAAKLPCVPGPSPNVFRAAKRRRRECRSAGGSSQARPAFLNSRTACGSMRAHRRSADSRKSARIRPTAPNAIPILRARRAGAHNPARRLRGASHNRARWRTCLIHEHGAPIVPAGTDRVRRDEQHPQARRSRPDACVHSRSTMSRKRALRADGKRNASVSEIACPTRELAERETSARGKLKRRAANASKCRWVVPANRQTASSALLRPVVHQKWPTETAPLMRMFFHVNSRKFFLSTD